MLRIFQLVLIFILVCAPAYSATQIKEDGTSKGYFNIIDFQNCPAVTKSGIEAQIDFSACAGSGSGDAATVNSSAVDTTANFLDSIYHDFSLTDGGPGGPDDVTVKPNYAETLAGNPALLVDECIWAKDTSGGFILCEGSTADTNEQAYRFPDVNGADTTSYFLFTSTAITPTANIEAILAAADYAAVKALLDLEIGTDVQAYDADLTTWAGITPGTLTDENVCEYESTGTLLECATSKDASGTCASGSLCAGGHTHPTTEISGVNAGTDLTADLEEEVTAGSLANDTILEEDLKAVDAASDEECLTYETTTGDFEWQSCGSGGGAPTDATYITQTANGSLSAEQALSSLSTGLMKVTTTTGVISSVVPGTGVETALAVNVGSAGAFVVNGGALGTPSSGTLTNATGLPVSGITSSTSTALGVGSLELGHATDTTIARVAAGRASIENVEIPTVAGRSLTASTNTFDADAELYTDTKCLRFENPVAADDLKSIWYAKNAVTITSIWCESDQTVTAMLQVDDGTPADVDSVDLTCDATPPEDTSLDGDATMAAGDRLDLDVVSVASTPTWVTICWTSTKDD